MSANVLTDHPIPAVDLARDRTWTFTWPSIRDPRLHLSAVILSVHVIGQAKLQFQISIAQILLAIGSAVLFEFVVTAVRYRRIEWPASAVLTGSGVALVLRVHGTEWGDWWSLHGWYYFVVVAVGSLLAKHLVRYRDEPVFNPSNLGLVAVFLIAGSSRVEPLDFWWGEWGEWVALATGIILVGGVFITRRLHYLEMAGAFWVTLVLAVGALSASGHCITARWSISPVCDGHFWWIIVTSPEVLIFLFFMITDPKTTPKSQVGRVVMGVTIALLATFLMAPQSREFEAKVALLSSLVLVCAIRPFVGSRFPVAGTDEDRLLPWIRATLPSTGARYLFPAGGVLAGLALLVGLGIPAREPGGVFAEGVLAVDELPVAVNTGRFGGAPPLITIDAEVHEMVPDLTTNQATNLVADLMGCLEGEASALVDRDVDALADYTMGRRLSESQALLESGPGSDITITSVDVGTVDLVVAFPNGVQGGPAVALSVVGTAQVRTVAPDGAVVSEIDQPHSSLYVLGDPGDGRRLLSAVLPP